MAMSQTAFRTRPALYSHRSAATSWMRRAEMPLFQAFSRPSCPKATDGLCIKDVTTIDPAVGSGHFLVSVLNYIVALKSELGLLSVSNKIEIQNDSIVIYEQDGETQFEYKRNNQNSLIVQKAIFDEKRNIIENCLFGVDINPNSVEICRLRLWIELLKNTYYIENTDEMQVLPNIDINIKCGDSLVSAYDVKVGHCALEALDGRTAEAKNIKEYKKLVAEYKNIDKKVSKHDLMEQIKAIKDKIFPIRQLKIFENVAEQGVFANSMEWMIEFPELLDGNGIFQGFDIVIGNPPYIQLQKFKGQTVQNYYKEAGFKVHDSNGDIYCLFYEKGINILKNNGVLCFITSNKWMRAGYGEKLREFFIENNPIQLVDFSGFGVFDKATVDVNIILIEKNKYQNKTKSCTIGKDFESLNQLSVFIEQNSTNQTFDKNSWCILNPIEQSIKEKIEQAGIPLKDWDININYGIKTGLNDAFIIDGAKKDELIAQDPKSAEIIRPILRGRDIKRYSYDFADKWLINVHNGTKTQKRVDINNYPVIKEHLDKYYAKLAARDDQGDTPYNLRCCAYMDDFNSQIIAWQRITQKPTFCITKAGFLVLDSMAFISNGGSFKNWLLAILNSDLIYFWAKINVHEYGDTGFRLSNQYVEQISVPKISAQDIETIDFLVSKQSDKYNSETEKEIQRFVFKIYGITEEEIKIIYSKLNNN